MTRENSSKKRTTSKAAEAWQEGRALPNPPQPENLQIATNLQRRAYLSNKKIDPNQPFQLDLLFPTTLHDSNRFIPNDYARSSLYTVRNKNEPRRVLENKKLFHLHENVTIVFTGIELRAEDDELVWLQIMHYAKSVPFGEPFEFEIKNLVADLNWPRNGRYYDKARECISRLKANEIKAINEKAYGDGGALSLIDKYEFKNDAKSKPTRYRVWIDPNLIHLFAGNTFTNHQWDVYRKLSPVARRLADYVESHAHPYPLSLSKFQHMCDSSDSSMTSWRQTTRKACAELEDAGIAKSLRLDPNDDKIYASK